MSVAIKPESADLAEIKTRLKARGPGNYCFVALLGLRNYEPGAAKRVLECCFRPQRVVAADHENALTHHTWQTA